MDCNSFSVRCPADIKIRTDSTDASTEDTISAGMQEYILSSWQFELARFQKGRTMFFLQTVTGNATAILKYVV